MSDGQDALLPVQLSTASQTPAAPRQLVPATTRTSPGQSLEVPSQSSATSQTPAEERHSSVLFASIPGQSGDVPSQTSAASHTPAAGRQTLPSGDSSLVQVPLVQVSLSVQT